MCKIEATQAYFSNKLKPSTKDSKIRKKMVKRASRTILESANYWIVNILNYGMRYHRYGSLIPPSSLHISPVA